MARSSSRRRNLTVLAEAHDVDGTVTNVQFFHGTTNLLGATGTTPPYCIVLTNVPVGSYTFSAKATDNLGATRQLRPGDHYSD